MLFINQNKKSYWLSKVYLSWRRGGGDIGAFCDTFNASDFQELIWPTTTNYTNTIYFNYAVSWDMYVHIFRIFLIICLALQFLSSFSLIWLQVKRQLLSGRDSDEAVDSFLLLRTLGHRRYRFSLLWRFGNLIITHSENKSSCCTPKKIWCQLTHKMCMMTPHGQFCRWIISASCKQQKLNIL